MRKLFRVLVMGLLVAFVAVLLGLLLYPQRERWNAFNYTLNQVATGEYLYYAHFRLLSRVVTVDALEYEAPVSGNILPLEHLSVAEDQINAILEEEDTLVRIPSIDVQGKIVAGASPENMNRGFWHYPTSGVPGDRRNTIIIGHRFQHVPPARNTFYNLDKVEVGQKITLTSDIGQWGYVVINKKVVDKYDTSVLSLPNNDHLVLITCHPLWTSRERLVIIAKPEKANQYI